MIDGHSVLGVILARGGSKGLRRKNVRDLAGKPLIAWTIEAGHASEHLDRLILSSDDEEIMSVAEEYGCEVPFRRPDELARDHTPSMEALLHAIGQVEDHDYVVLLQPTSPLRTADDIDGTIERCHQADASACVTVTETNEPPEWMYALGDEHQLEPFMDGEEAVTRRQDTPAIYVLNGAVYVARSDWLRGMESFLSNRTVAHVMSEKRSADVDTALDLAWCEFLIEREMSNR